MWRRTCGATFLYGHACASHIHVARRRSSEVRSQRFDLRAGPSNQSVNPHIAVANAWRSYICVCSQFFGQQTTFSKTHCNSCVGRRLHSRAERHRRRQRRRLRHLHQHRRDRLRHLLRLRVTGRQPRHPRRERQLQRVPDPGLRRPLPHREADVQQRMDE